MKRDYVILAVVMTALLIASGAISVFAGKRTEIKACDGNLHMVLTNNQGYDDKASVDYYWTCVDGNILYLTQKR